MCGRFAFFNKRQAAEQLHLDLPEQALQPRYNVAPGTWILAAYRAEPECPVALGEIWWGYRPHWAGEKAPQPINARLEKVASSRFYSGAFVRHRCIIPADGWYEWLPTDHGKQPHYLTRDDRQPVWLAGIFAPRADGTLGGAIITHDAEGSAREVHDRMPLALDESCIDDWLDGDLTDKEMVRQLIQPLAAERIEHWPVSTSVNRPGNDEDDSLINPA
ncbi:SOS response-associated peptidase [Phytohalomonas tamaricis]|uniref:SOS response-associated peptidase n=1 Tax=Phytohalomonas tamaricis TaxID=2081032 RepID=UPI000D0B5E90|nr:SOS response-associated peptidase [Phytohalomonas tamaricis]